MSAGPIETAVLELIADVDDEEIAGQSVYAAMATRLARTLDDGAGLAVAAVNRELRETIKAMTMRGDAGDGDSPRADDLFARMSAPLGNPAN